MFDHESMMRSLERHLDRKYPQMRYVEDPHAKRAIAEGMLSTPGEKRFFTVAMLVLPLACGWIPMVVVTMAGGSPGLSLIAGGVGFVGAFTLIFAVSEHLRASRIGDVMRLHGYPVCELCKADLRKVTDRCPRCGTEIEQRETPPPAPHTRRVQMDPELSRVVRMLVGACLILLAMARTPISPSSGSSFEWVSFPLSLWLLTWGVALVVGSMFRRVVRLRSPISLCVPAVVMMVPQVIGGFPQGVAFSDVDESVAVALIVSVVWFVYSRFRRNQATGPDS